VLISGTDAGPALEALMPVNLMDLRPGRMRYGFFTLDNGGVLDDLMITRRDDDYLLVINASRKTEDLQHLSERLPDTVSIKHLEDRGMVALQGPRSAEVLSALAPDAAQFKFMSAGPLQIADVECWVSRSGYTGEDGYEIAMPGDQAETVAQTLIASGVARPVGLGARDTLRLEAGLCLYGHELDTETSPVEAGLNWAMQKIRRPGGERAGGYPGQDRIERELNAGPANCRVGLQPQGRAPVREPSELLDAQGEVVGKVSSGGFSPSLGCPISIGYLPASLATPGTQVDALVRGKKVPVNVVELPFVAHRYAR
jgi:aminomethyltransferase